MWAARTTSKGAYRRAQVSGWGSSGLATPILEHLVLEGAESVDLQPHEVTSVDVGDAGRRPRQQHVGRLQRHERGYVLDQLRDLADHAGGAPRLAQLAVHERP